MNLPVLLIASVLALLFLPANHAEPLRAVETKFDLVNLIHWHNCSCRTSGENITLPKNQIANRLASVISLIPEGLLKGLNRNRKRFC